MIAQEIVMQIYKHFSANGSLTNYRGTKFKKKKKRGYVCFDSLYFGLVQFDVFLGLLDDFLG